ncbi:MAG: hypothetical protein F9K22_12390 [Bacteroidetes bacterium]|nr:MAG: hypothetical protein F9K22_12390 [Bacteroidota bacterium]
MKDKNQIERGEEKGEPLFKPLSPSPKKDDIEHHTEKVSRNPSQKESKQVLLGHAIQIVILFVTMISVFLYYKFTGQQISQFENSIKSSDETTRRSIAIAESALSISKQSVAAQEKMSKIGMRGYISTYEVLDFRFSVGEQPKVLIQIKNDGKTPAHNIVSSSIVKTGSGVYQEEIDKIKKTYTAHGITLGAGNSHSILAVNEYDWRAIDSLNVSNGRLQIYVYGKIWYRDVFGENHITTYALGFDVVKQSFFSYPYFNSSN